MHSGEKLRKGDMSEREEGYLSREKIRRRLRIGKDLGLRIGGIWEL